MTGILALALATVGSRQSDTSLPPARPPLLIHVMPWFEKQKDKVGFHWKMNRLSEDVLKSGRVASHFQPLIGAYDSLDADVVELQVLWMKYAGFDGVLADWYGVNNFFDYPMIHARTKVLFDVATKAGMSLGIVYEDQTVGNAIRENVLKPEEKSKVIDETGTFLKGDWLKRPNWLRIKGKPVVMVFGPQAFDEKDWATFTSATGPIQLLTLHQQKPFAQGGYDWPIPSLGTKFNVEFVERSKKWGIRVPVAYPRFVDYYEEGGQKGYPDLPDLSGKTYRESLANAIALKGDAIQVATWNDWQEGTQIEPSLEFGMRDLIATQEARKKLDPAFAFKPSDLNLPFRLYQLRKSGKNLDIQNQASQALFRGDPAHANKLLQ